jgi:hypothetical protein
MPRPNKDHRFATAAARAKSLAVRRAKADARAQQVRAVLDELANMSARAAARELNARNIKTRRGGKWWAKTVSDVRKRLMRMQKG